MDVQDSTGYHHGLVLFLYVVVIERMKKMNMEINGVTLRADFMDVDFMEKFEPAIYKVQKDINASKTMQGTVAARYKAMNQVVEDFFNNVFGKDVTDRIFQGSKNVKVHLEALAQVEEVQRAEKKQFNDLSSRYTQRQNGFQSMQEHQKKQNNRRDRT